jgi:SPP1 gp7 family putative phage head morphogenesis protein
MPPKPPRNPKLDAKVLARRQKDLNGFIENHVNTLDKRALQYASEVRPFWIRVNKQLTAEIKAIYRELQDANGVPITKKPIDKAKYRNMQRQIDRLQKLNDFVAATLAEGDQKKKLERNLAYTFTESFYFNAFNLEQAAKVAVAAPILTQSQVMGVLANPWLPDGKTYSDRIRANTTYLAGKMRQAVEESVGAGWSINRTARRITEIADEGYYNAVRLARTEMTRASSQGASHSYMENADILDGKRWNAVLDAKTAPKDADNDGKLYPLDYDTEESPGDIGERIPNHPNCRCVWSPVLSALGISTKERIARGNGASTDEFGERIYTKARTFREYAKERGLPDLDERLRNDNPRKYLRRGEKLPA